MGGSGAIADALARGVTKHGGTITRRAHVEEILVEGGRAVGVRVRGGRVVRASKGVVSNCDLWGTYKLVPTGASAALDEERTRWERDTKQCGSFMHLHLGIDAAGLPDNLPPQWTVAQDWSLPIDAPGNVIVVSVPSLLDPSLAPPGRHVIHAYTAGAMAWRCVLSRGRPRPSFLTYPSPFFCVWCVWCVCGRERAVRAVEAIRQGRGGASCRG